MKSIKLSERIEKIRAILLKELKEAVGEQWVEDDPCFCDSYAWQMNAETITGSHFMPRAIMVVLPETTEEVSAVMKICHKYGVQAKPMGSGQGPWNAPQKENNSVQIDLRRMDRIHLIDEKNMYAVVETYVTNNHLQVEAMKVGLNCHIIGAGGQSSQLAAATSFNGHGPDGLMMGFAGRNLMGFEWVLPDGEIVQVGSLHSSGKMFSGDGPGPSMRGIIRGFAGAMGGLGIFTKCAVKLYRWEGPKKLTVSGYSPNLITDIPKTHLVGMLGVPGWKEIADLGYDLGEGNISTYALRNAPSLTIPILYSSGAEALKGLQVPMLRVFNHNLYVVCDGLHEKEKLYKQKVLSHITKLNKGGVLGNDPGIRGLINKARFMMVYIKRIGFLNWFRSLSGLASLIIREAKVHGAAAFRTGNPLDAILYGKFIKADANVRATMALGGNFVTSLGTISPWDLACKSAQIGGAIQKRYIKRGEMVDNEGDGGHGGLYEGGAYSHIETVSLYDPNDEKHIKAMPRICNETNAASIQQRLGISINSFGPDGSDTFSTTALNYDKIIQKIKKEFDPENTADAGWYTDPDFEIPSEKKEMMKEFTDHQLDVGTPEVSQLAADPDIPEDWLLEREYHLL